MISFSCSLHSKLGSTATHLKIILKKHFAIKRKGNIMTIQEIEHVKGCKELMKELVKEVGLCVDLEEYHFGKAQSVVLLFS